MASIFYDAECRRTSKVIHVAPKPCCESSPADFAVLYTEKNGTPVLYRNDRTPCGDKNDLAVCTPSSVVQPGVMWPCNSSFNGVTFFSDDLSQSMFCNQYNVQTCLQYLNQVS